MQMQLAPIKSAAAVVYFDILDDTKRVRLGQAHISLSRLSDQILHEMMPLEVSGGAYIFPKLSLSL